MSEQSRHRSDTKTIRVSVRFWTDELPEVPTERRRAAWFKGAVNVDANTRHGIRSDQGPLMFNKPEDLTNAIVRALTRAGVTLIDPRTREEWETDS